MPKVFNSVTFLNHQHFCSRVVTFFSASPLPRPFSARTSSSQQVYFPNMVLRILLKGNNRLVETALIVNLQERGGAFSALQLLSPPPHSFSGLYPPKKSPLPSAAATSVQARLAYDAHPYQSHSVLLWFFFTVDSFHLVHSLDCSLGIELWWRRYWRLLLITSACWFCGALTNQRLFSFLGEQPFAI